MCERVCVRVCVRACMRYENIKKNVNNLLTAETVTDCAAVSALKQSRARRKQSHKQTTHPTHTHTHTPPYTHTQSVAGTPLLVI